MSSDLVQQIEILKEENRRLKDQLENISLLQDGGKLYNGLSLEEYRRYGRQMIVSEFGSLQGQLKLKSSKVVVVGAGGLGCPALMYLAGSGIGTIGIVDDDIVDVSNLHRQVLHSTTSVGQLKCESAKKYLQTLNPNVNIVTFPTRLTNLNAFEIFHDFDMVLDCTDAPASRYLISDVAVYFGIPVVSGSGLRTEGQLSVFNYEGGPCYRCFYPDPPAANSVTSCSDGGVIGPVIGMLGTAMAVEAIKVATGYYHGNFKPFLSMYSGYPQQSFRVFKMRGKQPNCICRNLTKQTIEATDYSAFCGSLASVNLLSQNERVSVKDYDQARSSPHILLDVRPKEQFDISSFPDSISLPWDTVLSKSGDVHELLPQASEQDSIYVVCRYGNDSQFAARKLLDSGFTNVKDIKGGWTRWYLDVDQVIPFY